MVVCQNHGRCSGNQCRREHLTRGNQAARKRSLGDHDPEQRMALVIQEKHPAALLVGIIVYNILEILIGAFRCVYHLGRDFKQRFVVLQGGFVDLHFSVARPEQLHCANAAPPRCSFGAGATQRGKSQRARVPRQCAGCGTNEGETQASEVETNASEYYLDPS